MRLPNRPRDLRLRTRVALLGTPLLTLVFASWILATQPPSSEGVLEAGFWVLSLTVVFLAPGAVLLIVWVRNALLLSIGIVLYFGSIVLGYSIASSSADHMAGLYLFLIPMFSGLSALALLVADERWRSRGDAAVTAPPPPPPL